MSTPPDKPESPVRWETIERVAARADAERLGAMSEEELDAMLGQAGFDPGDADRIARRALGRRRRPRWVVAVVAAAAVLLVLLAWKRREVVAFFTRTPEPIGPGVTPAPTRVVKAPEEVGTGTRAAVDAGGRDKP